MLGKITKAVFALIAAVLALALVVAASLGVWLLTGPKQLTNFVPYVEDSLNPDDAPYRTEISDILVRWESLSQPVDFQLQHVSIYTRDEETKLMRFNEVSVGLSLAGLLRFRLEPESVVLRRPRMRFYRDDMGVMFVGIGNDDSQRVPLRWLLHEMKRNESEDASKASLFGNVKLIRIQNARVILGESGDAKLVDAKDANLLIRHEDGLLKASLDISFNYKEERTSYIRGDMNISDKEDKLVTKFELRDFSPHILSQLFPDYAELAALDLPLSGWVDVTLTDTGHASLIDFRLQGRDGKFAYDAYFAEPLAIESFKLEGQIRDAFREFMLKKAELDFGETTLSVNGIAHRYPQGWTADAIALAENMPVNDLRKYWPKTVAPTAYTWVTTHIREGVVPKAEAKLKLTKENIGQPFPEDALDITIQAQGVEVNYLDDYPKVEGVDGIVTFNGKGMTITSQKGKMLTGGVLKDAWLQIPDLMAKPAPMQIKLELEAPARDVATYIGIPALNFAEPLNMNPETITGQTSGKMAFDFVLPHHEVEDRNPHLTFVIDANITNGSQPGFMGYEQVSDANGKLHITEQQLKYDGTMSIVSAPLAIALVHEFKPKGEYQTTYQAKGAMTVEQLQAFHVPELPFLQGTLGVDATIRRNPKKYNVVATADLTKVAADVRQIGLVKPAGAPATLQFETDIAEGNLSLRSFTLKGDGMHIAGAAEVRDDISTLQALHLERVEYGDNNFAMKINRKGEGYSIDAKGASLDLQPLFGKEKSSEQAQAEAEKEDKPLIIDAKGQFDWIVFGKERELRNVVLRADCGATHCEVLNAQGITGQSDRFSFDVSRKNGVRRLAFNTQNAGGFLRAVNFYDGMAGGVMTVAGRFDDNAPNRSMKGELRVTEHLITNAPVLAKMASLLSLSGIGDALQGKGITFSEIESELGYADDVLTFKKGRAYGSSLGITVEDGAVNLDNKHVNVSGTVVPSYTLNTVLGNIPVIGEALSGGKGEGVFAATYKVEGQYPDGVEVTVNPLSMLAPGFLRNIFGSNQSATEAVKTPEAGSKPAPADNPPQDREAQSPPTVEPVVKEVVTPPSQ